MAQTQMFNDPFWFSDNQEIELNQFQGQTGRWHYTPDDMPLRSVMPESKWSEDSSQVEQPARRFRSPSNILPRLALQLPRFSQPRQKAEIRQQQQQQQQQPPHEEAQTLGNRVSVEIPRQQERVGTSQSQDEAEIARNGSEIPRGRAEIPEPLPPAPRTYITVHRHRTITGRILHRYSPNRGGRQTPPPRRLNPFNRRDRAQQQVQEGDDAPAWREILAFIVICMSHFCAHAGIGQTLPILKSIAIHFKVPNVTSLSWAIAGYALTLGVYILVSRRLGEVFGPKYIFLLGLASSALWAIVDGASFYSIPAVFIASRSFQGLGIALTLPTGLVLLGKTNPPGIGKELRSVIYRLMAPVGLVIGALGASLILNQTSWSAVYWAYFVVLVMLVIAGGLTLPSVPDRQDALSQPSEIVSELDIAGMMAGVCSLVLFGFAWVQADRVGWKQPYIWVALIMSVVFVMLFAVIERFYAANPLVPRSVQSGEISMILVAVGAGSSCFGIWIFYGWQFLESLKLVSPLVATGCYVPLMVIGCAAIVSIQFVLRQLKPERVLCGTSLATMGGCILLATRPLDQTYWAQQFVSVLLMAWSLYTRILVATTMVSAAVKENDPELPATLVNIAFYYGIAIGLGVAGTAENKSMSGRLTLPNRFRGYRAAYWTSVGMAVFGLGICLVLVLRNWRRRARSDQDEADEVELQATPSL